MTAEEIQSKAEQNCYDRFGRISPVYEQGYDDGYHQAEVDNPILQDIKKCKAIVVDKGWLEQHDRQMIDKAALWLQNYFTIEHQGMSPSGYMIFEHLFKKAME